MSKYFVKFISMMIICTLIINGCNRPQLKPPAKKNRSSYDKQQKNRISLIDEPVISLYLDNTGQKKWLKIEEYIQGVVAAEMNPKAPEAALEAQAIIARTFTYKKKLAGGVKKHNADASTNIIDFQAYNPQEVNDNIKKAVAKTRGILVYYNNNIVEAYFNKDNGGVTSEPREGLSLFSENVPYIKAGINDKSISLSQPDVVAWTARIPLTEVQNIIFGQTGKFPTSIKDVVIAKKGPSGRAVLLKFGDIKVSATAFRLSVGPNKMRSTLISDFYTADDTLVIKGRGHGHGVGLSQNGAVYLAGKGENAKDIIKFYYRNIEFRQLWK